VKNELRHLSGLMEVLAFTAGRVPVRAYSEYELPPELPTHRNKTGSAVEFDNGDILACIAYDLGDYSELTPGDGVELEFYAITRGAR
jgi:hypothetical protein